MFERLILIRNFQNIKELWCSIRMFFSRYFKQ